MENSVRIMNMSNGEEMQGNWETIEEATEWINEQEIPQLYEIMEEVF